jgi:hypothetical protein
MQPVARAPITCSSLDPFGQPICKLSLRNYTASTHSAVCAHTLR